MKVYNVTITGNELWNLVDYASEYAEKQRKLANDPSNSAHYRAVAEECAINAEIIIERLKMARFKR